MDSFLRRLKYYGIGFGIGLVFVFVFFQNRGCSWLPSNRVKNSLLERVIVVSDEEYEIFRAKGITAKDVLSALNDGEVHFGESKKASDADPKVYALDKDIPKKGSLRFYFTLPNESYITEVSISASHANKVGNSQKGKGRILRLPQEKNLLYVDSTNNLRCQLQEIGLSENKKLYAQWKKTARIDFERSLLRLSPKPEHYVEFQDAKGNWVGSKSIWYKNKISISSFDLPFDTDCND
ncbi:MAG: hypothetical protein ACK45H_04725 [Bacteroidota bacterium]|jgi:hypothetical protein